MDTVRRLCAHAHSSIQNLCSRPLLGVTAATVAVALVLCGARPLHAADIVVAPPCSEGALRAAVATLEPAGGGSIELACTADLNLTRPITVTAAISLTISGNTLLKSSGSRLFYVEPTGALTLRGLTLAGARATGEGGAIFSAGQLALDSVRLLDNQAEQGGAVAATGPVEIRDSYFGSNQAARGGALYIAQSADLTVTTSTFEKNKATVEGGALQLLGSAGLTNTTFSANYAPNGGAVRVFFDARASLVDCLMHDGAGEIAPALANSGETDMRNCTITDMVSTSDYAVVDNDGVLRITNTVFLDNRGVDANSLHNHTVTVVTASRIDLTHVTMYNRLSGGLAEVINNGDLRMRNTMINVAAGSTCYNGSPAGAAPTISSLGGNVFSDKGCFTTPPKPTDHFLGAPLGVATGPTGRLLVFPTAANPGVDGVACVAAATKDMRAVSRPQGKGCDSGAVEVRVGETFYRMLLPIIVRPK